MSSAQVPRSLTAAILGLAAASFLAAAVPARAQYEHRGPPPPVRHDRDWYRHHHRPPPPPPPPAYAPVYAPPAVVYTPPAPVGGINLIIPFNFR